MYVLHFVHFCFFVLAFFFCFNHGRGVNQFYTTRSRVHACTYARTHAPTYRHTHIYVYINTHTHIYTHLHIYTHTCICRIVVMVKARKLETTPQVCQLRISCFLTSGPQLVYQRPWYVLFCLWKSAYKRSLAAYRKE